MKICLISCLFPPMVFGGAEICVKRTAEGLVKRGHEVLVITTSPDRDEYIERTDGIKVYRIDPRNLYPFYSSSKIPFMIKPLFYIIDLWNPFSYLRIKDILKRELPDIVHINNFRGLSLSTFSAAKDLNIPLIFTAHDYSLICLKGTLLKSSGKNCSTCSIICKFYNAMQKFIVNNQPDMIIAPSEFVLEKLNSKGLFRNSCMMKLPLGLELLDKNVEKKYDVINILYIGSLSKHKGLHILIDAFKNLKHDNIVLHIVGKGVDANLFENMASADGRIIFHGFIPDDKLNQLFKDVNITIVPSIWYDNSPMVIYESLSHGIPVIGSNIGGIPELIEDNYNGMLFEAGNIWELSNKISYLVDNQLELKRLAKNAIKSAEKYKLENHICRLERIYSMFKENDDKF